MTPCATEIIFQRMHFSSMLRDQPVTVDVCWRIVFFSIKKERTGIKYLVLTKHNRRISVIVINKSISS